MERYAYCLCCYPDQEAHVARTVQGMVPCETILPLCSQRIYVKGQEIRKLNPFLPQYLYVFADRPIGKMLHDRRLTGVRRWLGTEEDDYALTGDDYRFAMFLRDNGGLIDYQTGYEVDGRISLLPYGREWAVTGEVVRVDRQRRRMQVRFRFGDTVITLWTGYDLVPAPEAALSRTA